MVGGVAQLTDPAGTEDADLATHGMATTRCEFERPLRSIVTPSCGLGTGATISSGRGARRAHAIVTSPTCGAFAVSDVIADLDMDDATRHDMQYVGCIAGALTHDQFVHCLADAGLLDVEITETHRVHEHAGSATVRAADRTERERAGTRCIRSRGRARERLR